MPPKKKEVPKSIPTMEDSPSENTKKATKALRPLQPVDPVDPDELEDPLALPDKIPRYSQHDGPSVIAAPRKKNHPRKLINAEEVDVIEWIQANPSIFNKSHAGYKNTKKRDQLFADKAAQLGERLTGKDLYKWYLRQRTAFTKFIKRPASGSGTVLMTARKQWVLESMSFLKGHCTSIPVRKGVDLTAARKKRYGDAPFQNIPASDPAAPEYAPSTTFYSFSPKCENL